MIDTDEYEGHTEGKWHCETGSHIEGEEQGTVELISSHSKEFHKRWLSDASLRHDEQQDENTMDERTQHLITNIAHIYHPDDEGRDGIWYEEHNRLVPDEIWQREQRANMRLIADAPLLLEEVKRLREGIRHILSEETAYDLEVFERKLMELIE